MLREGDAQYGVACWWVEEGKNKVVRSESAHIPLPWGGEISTPAEDRVVAPDRPASQPPLLRVRDLSKTYQLPGPFWQQHAAVHAVDRVSFEIERGQTVGLVGESGCGKTTLARMLVGLETPSQGHIEFDGVPLREHLQQRGARRWQMIFQNPYASLNPRWSVLDLLAEPLLEQAQARRLEDCRERVVQVLQQVGLAAADVGRYPHQFSGGQRQRLAIARALIAEPDGIVCDEPSSALDVSVQAQVLNLMRDLQHQRGLTLLLISHNLAIVRQLSHRVGVMYRGRLVEWSSKASLFARPRHPYTQMLLASVPDIGMPSPLPIAGASPSGSLSDQPDSALHAGCAFYARCPFAQAQCQYEQPQLQPVGSADEEVWVACHVAVKQS